MKPKEKSLKRYFPYKEYVMQTYHVENGQVIKAEFGFSLLDKGVYVIFLSICFTAKPENLHYWRHDQPYLGF